MNSEIAPNREALTEALGLAEEILKNIELSEISLTNIALKASRLARLLNDFDFQRIMSFEAGGYPAEATGIAPEVFRLAVLAGRRITEIDSKTKEPKEYIYPVSISSLEAQSRITEASLNAARDRDISITYANPSQFIMPPGSNVLERHDIRKTAALSTERLASRRKFIHEYTLGKYYELKFSGIADEVFSRIRNQVDDRIGKQIPESLQKLTAVHDNLLSDNPEDWSNAVHSCRRLLQDLADSVYPPRKDRIITENGKEKTVKLGKDNYINRIIAFLEEKKESRRFEEVVGSHLKFLGERLDSIFAATQKGSHSTIIRREEADRYVIYTYMLLGDILSLT